MSITISAEVAIRLDLPAGAIGHASDVDGGRYARPARAVSDSR
jgi:hypothetical protein